MPEKNLITTDYAYLIDSSGEYVTASDGCVRTQTLAVQIAGTGD